jgi:hypothetical protein
MDLSRRSGAGGAWTAASATPVVAHGDQSSEGAADDFRPPCSADLSELDAAELLRPGSQPGESRHRQ